MTRVRARRNLIIGAGASGLSALRHLRALGVPCDVTDGAQRIAALEDPDLVAGDVVVRLGELAAPRPLDEYARAVLSPGISPRHPLVQALRAAGVPVVNDIDLYAREVRCPVIAVTGSNGKSTVVSMISHALAGAGLRVAVGGNIGTPALELLGTDAQIHVLELSSFQLEVAAPLPTVAATCLNLSEDHLDRHAGMDEYAAAKRRIYAACRHPVVFRDQPVTWQGVRPHASYGLAAGPGARDWSLRAIDGSPWICCGEEPVLDSSRLKVPGAHNRINAMAALALIDAAGLPLAAAAEALTTFAGLPHRCQWVGNHAGRDWYDDSKGTNVGAALAAIEAVGGPMIWIGGGIGKGQDFSPLRAALSGVARAAVLIGRDGPRIAEALSGAVPVHLATDLHEAVRSALALSQPGDRILLSPACSSLDQFSGYAERGERFAAAARELAA